MLEYTLLVGVYTGAINRIYQTIYKKKTLNFTKFDLEIHLGKTNTK